MENKYTAYLRAGIGDCYSFVAQLPNFCKARNIKPEEIKVILDCHYTFQNQKLELSSFLTFLNDSGLKESVIVPESHNSVFGFLATGSDQSEGAKDEIIKDNFMFWCKEDTKNFIRPHIDGTLLFVPYVGQAFEWIDNKNVRLIYDQVPVANLIPDQERLVIDEILKTPHILIHYKRFGNTENENFANIVISKALSLGIHPIIIGTKNTNILTDGDNYILDLREKISFRQCMYITEKANLCYFSGANFAFHRTAFKHQNKYSLINWPMRIGNPQFLLPNDQFNHPTHFHFNSDIDEINNICNKLEEISLFIKEST